MNAPLPRPALFNAREVQARNLIATRARGLAIALEPSLELDLEPLGGDDGGVTHGLGPAESMHAEWGGARFELAFPRGALTDWLDLRLRTLGYTAVEITELGTQWRQTARALAVDWLFDALQRTGRGQARLVGETRGGDPSEVSYPAPAHVFALRLRFAGAAMAAPSVLHGRLGCDGLGLMLMSGLLAQCPPAPGALADQLEALPLHIPVRLGSTSVPLARLQSVRRGDVVLVTRPACGADGVFHLVVDRAAMGGAASVGVRVQIDNGSLITLDALTPLMSEHDSTPEAPLSVEQLPVRLDFDLGSTSLTVAELRALQPGQTLALDAPIGGAVTIRANGATIGEGEVVEIDGRVGVSIRALFPPQAPRVSAAGDDRDGGDDD